MKELNSYVKKSNFLAFCDKVISKIKSISKWVCRLRFLCYSYKPVPPEIRHLSFSFLDFIRDIITNREISGKIKDKYFKDRLVIICALPKSASSVIGSCIIELSSEKGAKGRRYARYMLANKDSDLRPELVQDFPRGGVLKYHSRASSKNLKVIEFLGAKYVILLRHPIDQLVALYCQVLNDCYKKEAIKENCWVYDHVYPLKFSKFQTGVNMSDTFQYMIREGYLNAALSWITDWLYLRDTENSLVLKYEDFVISRNKTLNAISNFLNGCDAKEDSIVKCNLIADRTVNGRASFDKKRVYSRGWTGKIGIWKNYFSERNKNDYISVVEAFLKYHPKASLMLDVYPNLLDIDNLDNRAKCNIIV
jgi:hypothetical protein